MSGKSFLGVAALVLATQAQAGFVDFTFNGDNATRLGDQDTNSYTENAGIYSVEVMPYLLINSAIGWESLMGLNDSSMADDTRVSRSNNAIGVNRQNSIAADNNNQIDGFGSIRDGLWFDFGNAHWRSLTITFKGLNTRDVFSIWMGDHFNPTSATAPLEHSVTGSPSGQVLSIADFHYQYLFVAVGEDGNAGTSCRNNTIGSVSTSANCFQIDNLHVVPEPGSMAMLGLGLAALGATWRRRRA